MTYCEKNGTPLLEHLVEDAFKVKVGLGLRVSKLPVEGNSIEREGHGGM